ASICSKQLRATPTEDFISTALLRETTRFLPGTIFVPATGSIRDLCGSMNIGEWRHWSASRKRKSSTCRQLHRSSIAHEGPCCTFASLDIRSGCCTSTVRNHPGNRYRRDYWPTHSKGIDRTPRTRQ